jgi:hypothetical protein
MHLREVTLFCDQNKVLLGGPGNVTSLSFFLSHTHTHTHTHSQASCPGQWTGWGPAPPSPPPMDHIKLSFPVLTTLCPVPQIALGRQLSHCQARLSVWKFELPHRLCSESSLRSDIRLHLSIQPAFPSLHPDPTLPPSKPATRPLISLQLTPC